MFFCNAWSLSFCWSLVFGVFWFKGPGILLNWVEYHVEESEGTYIPVATGCVRGLGELNSIWSSPACTCSFCRKNTSAFTQLWSCGELLCRSFYCVSQMQGKDPNSDLSSFLWPPAPGASADATILCLGPQRRRRGHANVERVIATTSGGLVFFEPVPLVKCLWLINYTVIE